MLLMPTGRALVVTHVLNYAKQRHIDLPEHVCSTPSIYQRNILQKKLHNELTHLDSAF